MQGVSAKDRPNHKPTVELYFRSVNLNYNTVRSWIHCKTLQTEMFEAQKTTSKNKNGGVAYLTQLEARLLGAASSLSENFPATSRCGSGVPLLTRFYFTRLSDHLI